MTPFILQGRKILEPETGPSVEHTYDRHLQLWVDRDSGTPVVSRLQNQIRASNFGETTITETREGADQSEVTTLSASQFGETTMTKAPEGTDQLM